MDGTLNIDKPAGITSHDVVNRVRRILHIKRVGHAGSLDPMATGVLVVCVGHATRIVELLMNAEKEYEGVMTLGATTDSEDSSGRILSETDASPITEEKIAEVLPKFIGSIAQTPPMVSAVHHEGKRLYELARQGKIVDRQPRQVHVRQLDLLRFEPGTQPKATLRVVCSKGLYVRTLFADIGEALGVGAHMSALRRTRVGRFAIADSIDLDTLTMMAERGEVGEALLPMSEALNELPCVEVSDEVAMDVGYGRPVPVQNGLALERGSLVRLVKRGEMIALARVEGDQSSLILQPDKVFV